MSLYKSQFPETYFELYKNEGSEVTIIQRYRTVYWEDCVNPNGYRDIIIAYCANKEIADKLVNVFNTYKFTSEYYDKRELHVLVRDDRYSKIKLYSVRGSGICCEAQLYNGFDQRDTILQIIPDKNGKYTSKSSEKEVCKTHQSEYVLKALNDFYRDTEEKIFNIINTNQNEISSKRSYRKS